jgi:EH domain-containing protein 1
VLSGEKQRVERAYDFIQVCGWFAARCDLILLLFDPYKLDISDEFKAVRLEAGRGGLKQKVCRVPAIPVATGLGAAWHPT